MGRDGADVPQQVTRHLRMILDGPNLTADQTARLLGWRSYCSSPGSRRDSLLSVDARSAELDRLCSFDLVPASEYLDLDWADDGLIDGQWMETTRSTRHTVTIRTR
jgi:hypothetical protein